MALEINAVRRERTSNEKSAKAFILLAVSNLLLFLFLLLYAKDLFPLAKHVHVHGREEGDVEQHGDEDEEREAEAGVESVGEVEAEEVPLVGVLQPRQLAQQLPRHAGGVGHDEECVPG